MSSIPNNLFAPKGGGYDTATPASHYYDPLVKQDGSPRGNSRKSGDASIATQTAVINAVIQQAAAHHLTIDDTALLLAIVRTESGFNPDAAAGGNSSATGIGQMTDPTAAPYGITSANRWDLSAQTKATVGLFIKYKNLAKIDGLDSSHIYAFWHDGEFSKGTKPKGNYLSKNYVMPLVSEYRTYLEGGNFGLAAAPGNGYVSGGPSPCGCGQKSRPFKYANV
jgi:putative chitinase